MFLFLSHFHFSSELFKCERLTSSCRSYAKNMIYFKTEQTCNATDRCRMLSKKFHGESLVPVKKQKNLDLELERI